MNYRLQKYEDGSYGYLGIDGNEKYNFRTESPVVCMQGEGEDREEFISKNGITFRDNQYGSDETLDRDINDTNEDRRMAVACIDQYGYDKLMYDESAYVRAALADNEYRLDIFINDESSRVRVTVAQLKYGLEQLINDKDESVRAAVAEQGYGLEKLINDKSDRVRRAVAEQGFGLEKLINDENEWVRRAVAKQGYELDKLINDKSENVREIVAWKGHGIDILINDKDMWVARAANEYLVNNDLTLDEWINQNK